MIQFHENTAKYVNHIKLLVTHILTLYKLFDSHEILNTKKSHRQQEPNKVDF